MDDTDCINATYFWRADKPYFSSKIAQPIWTFILCLLFKVTSSFAATPPLVLVTDDAPPHMIRGNHSGIDIDITRDVLLQLGYQVSVTYAPLERARMEVQSGRADLTVPTFYQSDDDGLYLSDPIIRYRPTIFTLSRRQLPMNDLSDLRGLNVATFQGATGYFGAEFESAVTQSDYREMHDMSILPSLLLKGRADAVVLDYYIFHYYARKYVPEYSQYQVFGAEIIPPANAHVAFRSASLRDSFNQSLAVYQQQGKAQAIVDKYIGAQGPVSEDKADEP